INLPTFTPKGSHKSKLAFIEAKSHSTRKRARRTQKELNRQSSLHKSTPSNAKLPTQQPLTALFTPKPYVEPKALLPPVNEKEEDIYDDIDSSDDEDLEFDALIEAEFEAKDYAIIGWKRGGVK
ncbi:hypothetical protein IFR05_017516, partial [Cadophora sp. M221]